MKKMQLKSKKMINDFIFFFCSVVFTISFFIFFLTIKNECIFLKDEIFHLERILINHNNRVKVLSGKVKKLSRQDYIEKIAFEKFGLHIPNPESLIVYIQN